MIACWVVIVGVLLDDAQAMCVPEQVSRCEEMRVCYPYTCHERGGCCQDFRNTCDWGVDSLYDCNVVIPRWAR